MSGPAVDAHVHTIPPSVVELIRAGEHPAGMVIEHRDGTPFVVHPEGYGYPLAAEFHDADALMAAVRGRGAEGALISPAPPLFGYDLGLEDAVACSRLTNDGVAEVVGAHPGRAAGLATIPLSHPEAAAAELERAVGELGLAGAEVGPNVGDAWLDDARLAPVLEAAERLGALLFVHPYYTGSKPGLEDMYLTNLVGNPLDTALCASRLILSGTLDRLPGLKLLLAHGGGYMPYQVGRLTHGNAVRPELGHTERPPTEYLDSFLYDTILFEPRALRYLVDQVGPERVLYGSDEPFDMSGGPIEWQLDGAGLSEQEHRAIAGGNAARMLGILAEEEEAA